MKTEFKLWSESNPDAKENISPRIGMREWNELTTEDKERMLKIFTHFGWFKRDKNDYVIYTILSLNKRYKNIAYGKHLLNHGGPHYETADGKVSHCCYTEAKNDLSKIFIEKNQDVVYEMLTIHAKYLIEQDYSERYDSASDENEKVIIKNEAYELFDKFADFFNDTAKQFSINIMLTRSGFIFRQDEKITEDIFVPVINYLSDKKWELVNRDLGDAFKDYQDGTEQGYSSCVTHSISALQAFLQLIVNGKTGKDDISLLILTARNKNLIPDDKFTEKIFKNIESILMFERQETGDPHPKKEYATEKNARLVLNLVMIFLQHCIQDI